MLCVDVPEDCGGCGAPFQYSVVVGEELARMGFGALSTNVMVHSDIVAPYLSHIGNDEQKQQWLPKMVSGEAVGAIAMTEPGAGSDLQAIRTSAVKDGDDYILNGSKTFITNGQHADMVIVAAKTDPNAGAKGISLFLVDTSLPGFSKGRNLDKIGQHRLMPLAPALGSVLAATMTMSACWPLVMKVLEPFRMYSSPSFTALVRMACRSLPAPGSVMAMAPTASPETIFGSHCCF